ncbi:MAG: DNA replication/repair protein RecF [Micropepsaceae bacterium]
MSSCEPLAELPSRVSTRVAVTRLMLTNFRSYGMLDVRTDGSHVVLVGPNGAGKTNVLEALSMFAPGRGLRGARLSELSRSIPGGSNDRPWAISATLSSGHDETQIGVGYLPGNQETGVPKRTVRRDGVPVSNVVQLAEHIRLIWLSPAMDRIFVEGVSERRRFLDRLIASFDPLHARRWSQFETAMRERIGALRANGAKGWLRALERTMAETGVAVAASRLTGVQQLVRAMDEQGSSNFPRANLALAGFIENALGSRPAVDIEDEFTDRLEQTRDRDFESGRTSIGPHATDFLVSHREKGRTADMCSTGEQKALLIRLMLACASLPAPGAPDRPVLLLDEVAAHLDDMRRRALFDEIEGLQVQAWMTGTDAVAFAGLEGRAQFRRVADGQIRPM